MSDEDSEEGSVEDSPRNLFLLCWGGLGGALGFGWGLFSLGSRNLFCLGAWSFF